MKFIKRVMNKKVIALVLSAMMLFSSTIKGNTESRKQMNENNIKVESKINNQKTIGIKTRAGNKRITKVAGRPMQVGATAYHGDKITSTGTRPIVGKTIAVDPKVIPYGTRVYIPEFNKIFTAEDCGSLIKGNRIDIFMNSYNECINWGFKQITIYIIEE